MFLEYKIQRDSFINLNTFCKQEPKNNPRGYSQWQGHVSFGKEGLHSSPKNVCAAFFQFPVFPCP